METKDIFKEEEIVKAGIDSEFWKNHKVFLGQEINRVSGQLISGDFRDLKEVYFLKGQLIGLAKSQSRPKKILEIARKAREREEKKEDEKKEE